MGWAGIKNGELLRRASTEFNAFVTIDQNLRFQQNLFRPGSPNRHHAAAVEPTA
jgi:hypothetical protein